MIIKKYTMIIILITIAFCMLGSELYLIEQKNAEIKRLQNGNGFSWFKLNNTVYCLAGATARYKLSNNEAENILSKSAAYVEAFEKAKITLIMQTFWNYTHIEEIGYFNDSFKENSFNIELLLKTGMLRSFEILEISEQNHEEYILVYVSIIINTDNLEKDEEEFHLNQYSFEYFYHNPN